MPESLYLIDGHAQIFRAYYAPFRDLTSPSGEPTRATYVFCSMLFNLIRDRRPDYLAVAIDTKDSAASRRELFPDYKTSREPPPEDLLPQIDRILQILDSAQIPVLSCAGYEADDVLATVARQATLSQPQLEVFIVSRDKDLEQLISERIRLFDPFKNETLDTAKLLETKGYSPQQAIDIQTLTGDSIDDIPGVVGVGLKTAAKLVQRFGSAERVLKNADQLTPKARERMLAFAEQLPVTRQLVTLRDDLAVDFDLERARLTGLPAAPLQAIFDELQFSRLRPILDELCDSGGMEPQVAGKQRASSPANGDYQLVDTEAALVELAAMLAGVDCFAFDTETTSLNPVAAEIVGLSIAWEPGVAYYVPIRAAVGRTLSQELVVRHLGPVFANERIGKCGHNLKFDLIVAAEMGLTVRGIIFDTLLASFLLDPLRRSHSMDHLADELLGEALIPITDLIGRGKSQTTIDQIDTQRVCEYAAEDADFTWRLYEYFKPKLDDSPFEKLFRDTELPLVAVLAQMERNGVTIDTPLLERMSSDLAEQLESLTRQIHEHSQRKFNIDSPRQLAEVLFDEQGLRVVRKTKTSRSTDAETLATLAYETEHPLPALILQYRELTKLKSTYVDSLPKMICPKTARIHASYNMIGAVTGRLSSNDPNLQNIPVRTDLGREIRRGFIASHPENVLLSADYSQIELRLLAHYCQDPALLAAFEADEDIHRCVAAQVFEVAPDNVTDEQRNRAKAVNFGIIYGQSAFGLARTTGMTRSEAQQFIDRYFMRYPGIRRFVDTCIDKARQTGYAETILGRRRPLPELRSKSRRQKNLGERLAVNTVLQGSAADLIKRAMVDIHERIIHDHSDTRMIIQVHDELVFDTPAAQVEEEARQISALMCTALPLRVPLRADTGFGPNWLECKHGA